MTTEVDDYIQELQTKLIEYLEDHIILLNEADDVLYRTFTFPDSLRIKQNVNRTDSIDEIRRNIQAVRELQIRMPIVAPMKAGKSTIINAFIGMDFLPVRAEAMTTLPTAAVLKLGQLDDNNILAAQLVLADDTLKALAKLQTTVIQILRKDFSDEKELDNLLANSDLIAIAKAHRDDRELQFNFSNGLKDHAQDQDMLKFINDLVRISIYLNQETPNDNLLLSAFLKNIPNVSVNYQTVSNSPYKFDKKCQLLLIDTPGPNEAVGVDVLQLFVENELKKSDIVLVVVEYGHVNTKADDEIIAQIKNIRRLNRNTDEKFIYVLINKADQYREGDQPQDKLQQHVATLYGVPVDCVFLLSGSYSLIAQKFFSDHKKHGDQIDVKTSNTAAKVLETYCPPNWKRLRDRSTVSEVKDYADILYENSGLENVLDSVLRIVLSQVVKRCVKSAIDVCEHTNKTLATDVEIRLNGLQVLETELREEIECLEKDLSDLAVIETERLKLMQTTNSELENKLKTVFQKILYECYHEIGEIFNPMNKKWIDPEEKIQAKKEQNTELNITYGTTIATGTAGGTIAASTVGAPILGYIGLTSGIAGGIMIGSYLGWHATQYIMKILRPNENEVKFNNEDDAKKFIDNITDLVNQLMKTAYTKTEEDVSNICGTACTELSNQITVKMKTIIDRANTRLKRTFDIKVIPTRINMKLEEIHLNIAEIGHPQSYQLSFIRRLVFSDTNKSDNVWMLSRSMIQTKCEESVEANLERIKTDIVQNTMEKMKEDFGSLFSDLQSYLLKYKTDIEMCLNDKGQTKQNQDSFRTKLKGFQNSLNEKARQMTELNQSIAWEKLA